MEAERKIFREQVVKRGRESNCRFHDSNDGGMKIKPTELMTIASHSECEVNEGEREE